MADRYWVGGSANWDGTAGLKWSLTSGGLGGEAVPTAADDVYLDVFGITANISAAAVCKNLTCTGFTGSLIGGSALTVHGSFTLVPAMTYSLSGPLTFAATSAVTITTAGKVLTSASVITFNGVGGVWQLQDAFNIASGGNPVLTNGRIDLNNNAFNTTFFTSNNSNTRGIDFGSTGAINVNGNNGVIFQMDTLTNFTYTGTPNFNFTYTGAVGTRTIRYGRTAGGTESNAANINITAGTDLIGLNAGNTMRNVTFTGFTGSLNNNAVTIFGNLVISSGMTITAGANATTFAATSGTQQITSAGKTLDFPLIQNGIGGTVQLQDNLTMGSTRTYTLTAGTLDLSSGNRTLSTGLFASTNSNTRVIAFGTGNITTTGVGTVWNTASTTGFSYTGTPTVNISNNSATATTVNTGAMIEARALNFNYTTGTYTLTDTSAVYKSVNFTGFTGTIPNSVRTIYGNATFVAGMTLTAGANVTTFAATSGTNNITTAAKTLDFPITFFGLGGTFAFQDALTQGATRAFTFTAGTVQFKASATSTTGVFATSGASQKFLQSTTPGTQATLSQASGTVDVSHLTIQDNAAVGGATFNAYVDQGNIDAGNVDGWDFGISPIVGGAEYTYSMRSFTQSRRF